MAGLIQAALISLLCVAGPVDAQGEGHEAQTVQTLAVLNFSNRDPGNDWDWVGPALADMLMTDLSQSARLRVVERERIAWMLKELELGRTGLISPATAGEVGRLCRASLALFGSYAVDQDRIRIEGHVVEVATASLKRVEWVEGPVSELFDLENKLAYQLLERLDVALTEAERQSILYRATDSLDALSHYGRGLGSYDDGDYSRAIMEFRHALKQDPNYHEARVHLAAMYFAIGEPEHAMIEYRRLMRDSKDLRLTETAYFRMGEVLARGLGRYEEAIECYRRVVELHPEYDVDPETVQKHLLAVLEAGMGEGARGAAAKDLQAELNRRRKSAKERNLLSDGSLAAMGECYEELGDIAGAAQSAVKLLNSHQLCSGAVLRDPHAEELYWQVLLRGLDDVAPAPAYMIRVPTQGLELDGTRLEGLDRGEGASKSGKLYILPDRTDPSNKADRFSYDYRNRLIKVEHTNNYGDSPPTWSTVVEYYYDGLNRRVKKDLPTGTDVVYLNDGWQELEEREWDANDNRWEPRRQYVYGGTYIDEPLIFDKDTDSDGDCADAGGSSRYFYCQQANWNVVAVTGSDATIVEKIKYDPYGQATVTVQQNQNASGSPYLFQGRRWDSEVGLYYFRNRVMWLVQRIG